MGGPEHVEGNEHTSKEKLVENCNIQHISGYSSRMKEQIWKEGSKVKEIGQLIFPKFIKHINS